MWSSIAQNKALTVMVLLFFPVTLALGFWQLDRAQEKQILLAEMAATELVKKLTEATDLTSLPNFQRATLTSSFLPNYIWLLDNRIWQRQAGVDVLGVVKVGSRSLLVNLGWRPWRDRSSLPEVALPIHRLNLQGRLAYPSGETFVLVEDTKQNGYPRLLQKIHMPDIAAQVPGEIWPQILYLDDASEGVFQAHWQPINMGPEKHYGYAFQWFGLALTLLILYLYRIYQYARQGYKKGLANG